MMPTNPNHPAWCEAIDEVDEPCETHFGRVRRVELAYMAPERTECAITGRPAWIPQSVRVSLCQEPDAVEPLVTLTITGFPEHCLLLSLPEVIELVDALGEVVAERRVEFRADQRVTV